MNEKKKDQERVRKAYAKAGERSQKMMSFRLDNDLALWLDSQPNRGRYINNLIRDDRDNQLSKDETPP